MRVSHPENGRRRRLRAALQPAKAAEPLTGYWYGPNTLERPPQERPMHSDVSRAVGAGQRQQRNGKGKSSAKATAAENRDDRKADDDESRERLEHRWLVATNRRAVTHDVDGNRWLPSRGKPSREADFPLAQA
jgi:hypothetical protein